MIFKPEQVIFLWKILHAKHNIWNYHLKKFFLWSAFSFAFIGCRNVYCNPSFITVWLLHFRFKIQRSCRCCGEVGAMEVRFSKWYQTVQMVLWIYSYLYLWHTMWLHAEKVKVKLWKSLILLCNLGSRAQKSPKKPKKRIAQSRFTQFF